jgi:hypothetical protein
MWRVLYAIAFAVFPSAPAFADNYCKRYVDASLIGDGGSAHQSQSIGLSADTPSDHCGRELSSIDWSPALEPGAGRASIDR